MLLKWEAIWITHLPPDHGTAGVIPTDGPDVLLLSLFSTSLWIATMGVVRKMP